VLATARGSDGAADTTRWSSDRAIPAHALRHEGGATTGWTGKKRGARGATTAGWTGKKNVDPGPVQASVSSPKDCYDDGNFSDTGDEACYSDTRLMQRVGQDLDEEEGEREGVGSEWREWRRERGVGSEWREWSGRMRDRLLRHRGEKGPTCQRLYDRSGRTAERQNHALADYS
jgi:hypothetical protein